MPRRKTRLLSVALVAAALVSACSTPTWTSPPGPSAFQVGYRDGCDAGYAAAGSPFYERVDQSEPQSADGVYVDGWHVGYGDCKRAYNRIQTTIHSFFSV